MHQRSIISDAHERLYLYVSLSRTRLDKLHHPPLMQLAAWRHYSASMLPSVDLASPYLSCRRQGCRGRLHCVSSPVYWSQ